MFFKGEKLCEKSYGSSEGYDYLKLIQQPTIRDAWLKGILKGIGGISVDHPAFMDYESFSFKSLDHSKNHEERDNSYFDCLYLRLMTHMKERGYEMPPILSKHEDLRETMFLGQKDETETLLFGKLAEIISNGDERCIAHAKAEAEKIREYTTHIAYEQDSNIPLSKKFLDTPRKIVPGKKAEEIYNVLVIEDLNENYHLKGPELTENVFHTLEELGFCGSYVYSQINLPSAMEICSTGQMDAIIVDGRNVEPFESFYHGQGGGMTFGENGEILFMKDGEKMTEDEVKEHMRENPNIKHAWVGKICEQAEAKGHTSPPSYVMTPSDKPRLGGLLCAMLKGVASEQSPFS